jgi:hypothetical protein
MHQDSALDSLVVEQGDNFFDTARKLVEGYDRLLVLKAESGFAQNYVNNRKHIAFRIRSDSPYGGFVLQARDDVHPDDTLTCNRHAAVADHNDARHALGSGEKPFMLPQYVELVQGPNGVIPSLVRFERFDSSAIGSRKPLFAFWSVNSPKWINHAEFGTKDWEMPFMIRSFPVACGERDSQQIEGATQGIDDRTNPRVERERKRNLLNSYKQIISGLRIRLFDNAIGVSLLPFEKAVLQKWDLGFGPIDGSLSV